MVADLHNTAKWYTIEQGLVFTYIENNISSHTHASDIRAAAAIIFQNLPKLAYYAQV